MPMCLPVSPGAQEALEGRNRHHLCSTMPLAPDIVPGKEVSEKKICVDVVVLFLVISSSL